MSDSTIDPNELVSGVNRLMKHECDTRAPVNFRIEKLKTETHRLTSESDLSALLSEKFGSSDDLQSWAMFTDIIRTGITPDDISSHPGKILEAELFSASRSLSARIKRLAGNMVLLTFFIIGEGEELPCNTLTLRVRQDIAARKEIPGNAVYTVWYRMSDSEPGRITPYVQQFAGFSAEVSHG